MEKKPGANAAVIYVVYAAAVAFTGLVIAWAAFGWTPLRSRVPAGPHAGGGDERLVARFASRRPRSRPRRAPGRALLAGAAPAAAAVVRRSDRAGRRGPAVPPPRKDACAPTAAAASGSTSRATLRRELKVVDTPVGPGVQARLDRFYAGRNIVAIAFYHQVRPDFVDLQGNKVDPAEVDSTVVKGIHGREYTFRKGEPRWLQVSRVVPRRNDRLRSKSLRYTVEKVRHQGCQRRERRAAAVPPERDAVISRFRYCSTLHASRPATPSSASRSDRPSGSSIPERSRRAP